MREWSLKMEKYDISKERYKELLYFCRQYNQYKETLNYGVNAISYSEKVQTSMTPDNTVNYCIKNEKALDAINLIENCAKSADEYLYPYIIRNVTEGVSFEKMNVPIGRRQFYEARRKFFLLLDKRK